MNGRSYQRPDGGIFVREFGRDCTILLRSLFCKRMVGIFLYIIAVDSG